MTGLADILPSVETVEIRGRKVDVSGIDLPAIPPLLKRFPAIAQLFLGNVFDEALLSQSKEMTAAFIAAGCGWAGDEEQERGIANLKLGERAKLLAAVIRQTIPERDVGPFVEVILAMGLGRRPEPQPATAPLPAAASAPAPAAEASRLMKRSRPASSGSEQSDGALPN